jgi:outer membrane protein assembly factor BamB
MPDRTSKAESRLPPSCAVVWVLWRWMVLAGFVCPLFSFAGDWPQYRGPNHDGTSADLILIEWPSGGPPELWRRPLTNGFSSFAVSQGRDCTLETRGTVQSPQEVCLALNAQTGAELWATNLGPAVYQGGSGVGDGPRSTPSMDNGLVFVFSAYLKLFCLNSTNGHVLWSRDFMQEFCATNIQWQNAASPLVDGDLIFLNCNTSNGNFFALHKTDGHIVWRTGTDRLTHSTPVPATLHGVRQIIFYTESGLTALAATNGSVLWTYPFRFNGMSAAMSPVVWNDLVYCSATGDTGAGAVQITREGDTFTASELWRKPDQLRNCWSTPVCLDGYLYGLFESDSDIPTRALRCVNLQTGDVAWSQTGFVSGGILLVNGRLLILTETGELVLAAPGPFRYLELARAPILSGKCWNVPAVSDARIYARSTSEAVSLNVAVETPKLVQSFERLPDGRLCLRISLADGTPIDSDRFARIGICASTNLLSPLAAWSNITNTLALSDGVVQVNLEPQGRVRYFIAKEQP